MLYKEASTETLARRNIKTNGKTWHLQKTAEECCELSAAILKHLTKGAPEADIQLEIADVEIALYNLSIIYGRELIDKAKAEKLRRIEIKTREQERGI